MFLNKKSYVWMATLALVSGSAVMQGCGGDELDCSKGDKLVAYQKGESEGTAPGKAAGEALTYDQGRADGYSAGHSNGYDAGYYSAEGYAKGKTDGYAAGIAVGSQDVYSCSDGTQAGAKDGYAEGTARGAHDGYNDGFDDGYIAGVTTANYLPCASAGATPAKDLNSCEKRGYDKSFKIAYDAAKAANASYQNGRNVGLGEGYAVGYPKGKTAGYNAGYNAGYQNGVSDGQDSEYVRCYNAAFVTGGTGIGGGALNGYEDAYLSRVVGLEIQSYGYKPVYPSITDGTGGLGDGFHDGFTDGQSSRCGFATAPTWYGFGDANKAYYGTRFSWVCSWNGQLDSCFTRGYSAYMSNAQANQMDADLASLRSDMRTTARYETANGQR